MKQICRLVFVVASFLLTGVSEARCEKYLALADSADRYIKAERWSDAERVILKALRLEPANPGNPLLISNLGIIKLHQNEPEEAVKNFNIALSKTPRSTVLLTNRASAYIQMGDSEKAVEDLSTVLSVDSLLEHPRQMRGMLLASAGKIEEAIADFRFLISHFPENVWGPAGAAGCEAAMGNDAEAIRLYGEAIRIEDDPEYRFRKGMLELESGHIDKASEDCREGLKKDERNGNLYLLQALIHKKRYQPEEAAAAIKLAKEYNVDPQIIARFFKEK